MATLENELKDRFDRWDYLYKHGGQDPNWSDGSNLSLVRNHIILTKKKMEEAQEFPEIYYRETPPKVPFNYMARADEIRENAKTSLVIYKSNKDFQYLCEVKKKLNKKQITETCINNVINYAKGLEMFIEQDDLVQMRRHENAKRYVESFESCRKRVEILMSPEFKKVVFIPSGNQLQGQINLFDWIGG